MWGVAAVVATPLFVDASGVLATSSTGGFDVTSLVGTVVTPALVIVLLLFGKLRTEPEVKRLEADIDSLRAQVREKDAQINTLQTGIVDKAIPALARTTLVLETISPLLQTEVHLRRPPAPGGE